MVHADPLTVKRQQILHKEVLFAHLYTPQTAPPMEREGNKKNSKSFDLLMKTSGCFPQTAGREKRFVTASSLHTTL